MKGLFITGTDTNVGKTYIGALLAEQLYKQGLHVVPRKPVESGCTRMGDELLPEDALTLLKAASYKGSLNKVCSYRFEQAISPARAAKINFQSIQLNDLVSACRSNINPETDFLLVEGAGGFYSPICNDKLNADLAQKLKLPVLLVAENKLGCLNHILLSIQAIESRKLNLLAVILNKTNLSNSNNMDNKTDIEGLIDYPVFQVLSEGTIELPDKLIEIIS